MRQADFTRMAMHLAKIASTDEATGKKIIRSDFSSVQGIVKQDIGVDATVRQIRDAAKVAEVEIQAPKAKRAANIDTLSRLIVVAKVVRKLARTINELEGNDLYAEDIRVLTNVISRYSPSNGKHSDD